MMCWLSELQHDLCRCARALLGVGVEALAAGIVMNNADRARWAFDAAVVEAELLGARAQVLLRRSSCEARADAVELNGVAGRRAHVEEGSASTRGAHEYACMCESYARVPSRAPARMLTPAYVSLLGAHF
eukprot:4044862-Pleurochrysis_carterae.AAC.3